MALNVCTSMSGEFTVTKERIGREKVGYIRCRARWYKKDTWGRWR